MAIPATVPDKALVLGTLDRLLEDGAFGESDRQRNLLRYLVTEEIEGRGEAIKAFRIAVDVFGRGADFDPQTDSIVRTEVGRLRKALALYSATTGRQAPIEITIPTGSYRPQLLLRDEALRQAVATRMPRRWAVPTLVALGLAIAAVAIWLAVRPAPHPTLLIGVLRPTIGTVDQSRDFLQAGIRKEFVALLSHAPEFAVVPVEDDLSTADKTRFDYLVRSSVQIDGSRIRVQLLLLDGKDQRVVAERQDEAEFQVGELLSLQSRLAEQLALSVGRPFGLVARGAMKQAGAGASDEIGCYFLALRYFDGYDPADRRQAATCLRSASRRQPLAPHSLAALAYLDLLGTRYGDDGRSWKEAVAAFSAASATAYAANPSHWLVASANFTAALCRGELDQFKVASGAALEETPRNPALLADVGTKLALGAGDRAMGQTLVEKANALNPDPQSWYTLLPLAEAADGTGSPTPTLAGPRGGELPEAALLRLAVSARTSDIVAAAAARASLARSGITTPAKFAALLERSCWSPDFIAALRPLLGQAPGG